MSANAEPVATRQAQVDDARRRRTSASIAASKATSGESQSWWRREYLRLDRLVRQHEELLAQAKTQAESAQSNPEPF